MNADVVCDQVDQRDLRRSLEVDLLEQLDELDLSLTTPQDAGHVTAPCVERGEQVQGSLADVFVLNTHRLVRHAGRSVA